MTSTTSIWKQQLEFDTDGQINFACGDFELHCRSINREIQIAKAADEPEWNRWTVRSSSPNFSIQPHLPELAVLCEPESQFCVVPGGETRFFIEIPVSIACIADDFLLAEYPTETLSHTWFGELEKGELCYWIRTKAQLAPSESPSPKLAIAPIAVENQSSENLEISRICLRTSGLCLYLKNEQLWTSETHLKYQGGAANSKVKINDGTPDEAKGAKLIAPAREKGASGFVARTFRSLIQITSSVFED